MQAIILAAGMGKRLKKLTQNNAKCMIKVNGVTLIERMLMQLERKHFSRVVIVVGYMSEKLINYINALSIKTPIFFVNNPDYNKTNNIYSLALAKKYLCEDDTVLLESDLIFEDAVLDVLLDDSRESLSLVDKYECWMDGTCVKLTAEDDISEFIPGNMFKYEDVSSYYKTVNIYKFSKHFSVTHYVPFLDAYSKAIGNNEYYEQVLRVITTLDSPEIHAKRLNGQIWYEIDDVQDLDIAETLFASENKAELISSRFGGYWRYPKLLNFSDPINPYFPPKRMFDEIKANLERLITVCPSGAKVNSLLAAKNLGIDEEHCAVANGVEELIKSVTTLFPKTDAVGVVKPINEEFVQRLVNSKIVEYRITESKDRKSIDDNLIDFYNKHNINTLIISNPNTHTGEYIDKRKIYKILQWARDKDIKVIIDESYIDFVDEENASMITENTYVEFSNLIVLRNLAAAQGLFGLRIGCAVSANIAEVQKIRKDLTIWNINSVAEFYLQIFEKYKKIYLGSLAQTRLSRDKLFENLKNVDGILPFESDANFVTCKITHPKYTANRLMSALMTKNILVKNASERISDKGDYIRVAVRTQEDNDFFINAIKDIFQNVQREANEARIAGKQCEISDENTKVFFDERAEKQLPHRYNYVIYQDSNPSLALDRDRFEKNKIFPLMNIRNNSEILDIGCGVGRWADEILPHLDTGKYTGVDFSAKFLEIANKHFADSKNCRFLLGQFQRIREIFEKNCIKYNEAYDTILINGVLMYINDSEIESCISTAAEMMKKNGRVYIKESVGVSQRFTLKDFYSEELSHNYNAIYRSIAEYNELFNKIFDEKRFVLLHKGYTWDDIRENRTETSSYYWIYQKMRH